MKRRAVHSVDRQLGRLIALSGVLAVLAAWQRIGEQTPQFAPWWSVLAFSLVAAVVGLSLVGNALSAHALRMSWWLVIVGVVIAQSTIFLAFEDVSAPDAVDAVRPWIWVLEIVAMCLLGLLVPLRSAVVASAVILVTPLLSGLLFLGRIPDSVLVMTPIHVGNIAVLGVILELRRRLGDLHEAGEQHQLLDAERLRMRARLSRQRELARMVHDDVLSVLTAATRVQDRPDRTLRAGADDGLTALRAAARMRLFRGRQEVDAVAASRALAGVAKGFVPPARTTISIESGTVPVPVLDRASLALAEALRNSVRHASDGGTRVSGSIGPDAVRLMISDNGPGFDPHATSPERLGVRWSILQRMRDIVGGSARIRSDRRGTQVDLEWVRGDSGRGVAFSTRFARPALVLIWSTGVVHGVLLGRFPVVDGWIGVATYAIALAAAILITSRRSGPLSGVAAGTSVVIAVLIALSVLVDAELSGAHAGEVWLLTFAGYLLGMIAARGNVLIAFVGAAMTLLMVAAWGIGSHQDVDALAAMSTPTAVSFLVGCAWCLSVALIVRRQRSVRGALRSTAEQIAAARSAHRESEEELWALRSMAQPLLRRLSAGAAVDDEFRRELVVAEGSIRDRIRSPSLMHPLLTAEIARARARGTHLVLLDDDEGAAARGADAIAEDLAAAAAALIAQHVEAQRITIRGYALSSAVRLSITCIDESGNGPRVGLDSAGQVVNGQMSGT